MKYFLDTEFLEGTQKRLFGITKPTIDLISIGIVAEDEREYYAISKDFNLKEAWNRYDEVVNRLYPIGPEYNRVYWLRNNVLKPIFLELVFNERPFAKTIYESKHKGIIEKLFTYKNFKKLINKYGKTNKQIAEEIKEFCKPIKGMQYIVGTDGYEKVNIGRPNEFINPTANSISIGERTNPEFYGYYADYDWVVFCWLFGKMIDLPKGFPMYCIDLKQELDRYILKVDLPKQINEHNALEDARWNKQLYEFLKVL